MKFQFIPNVSEVFISAPGNKILTDPGIMEGVFGGSWFQSYSSLL
jgi:hypothetical protein